MTEWYRSNTADVLARLQTDPGGLNQAEAEDRLAHHGPNELTEQNLISPWRILWEQLTALMVVILIVAAAISALLGNYKDAVAIMAIVILSAVLGFIQDYRADRAMAALNRMAAPSVKVRRNGHVREISSRNVVPGDLVMLEMGNVVPADGRLLESVNLRTQESALTGESHSTEKHTAAINQADLSLADRQNMVYMGTSVTYGRGVAVVTATGMLTEFGQVAELIQTVERTQTPLQRRLDQLGRWLAAIALALAALILLVGWLSGEEFSLMFMTGVSVAVAVVPEALPAIVTIALALGAQRMLKRNVLIRKLPAVETLGAVTVICSDKTGTLTENRMAVNILESAGHSLQVSYPHRRNGAAVPTNGNHKQNSRHAFELVETSVEAHALLDPTLQVLLAGSALCSDAILQPNGTTTGPAQVVGEPTEGALVAAAAEFGLTKDDLEAVLPRVSEIPFTSERKLMTTTHAFQPDGLAGCPHLNRLVESLHTDPDARYLAFSKGAVDRLLDYSSFVWVDGRVEPLTEGMRRQIQLAHNRLAQNGMRGLGLAFRQLTGGPSRQPLDEPEQELIFVGLVGLIDPPRSGVRDAVEMCRTAGIKPVMITGDHPLTAQYIARELGVAKNGHVLTGQELASKSIEELAPEVEAVPVYARVTPEHKLKIVEAFQAQGHIVAMTGDGVNDAPALKKADIGVAMGLAGNDVAREAADMVLLDDNFATIVAAVKEGRVIYDNVRKYIEFSVAGNFGKVLVILLGPLLGMPLPLLPLQILWMNLVTDGCLALGLSVEPAERDTMSRRPHSPQENILSRGLGQHIVVVGLVIGLLALGLGLRAWSVDYAGWQTMILTLLIFLQIGQALALRSKRDSLFSIGLTSNRLMLGMVALTFVLQLAVIYVPTLQELFGTTPLSPLTLVITLLLSTAVFWGLELEKWIRRVTGS